MKFLNISSLRNWRFWLLCFSELLQWEFLLERKWQLEYKYFTSHFWVWLIYAWEDLLHTSWWRKKQKSEIAEKNNRNLDILRIFWFCSKLKILIIRSTWKKFEMLDLVAKKLFLTKGVGIADDKLTSFEFALRQAGIAGTNIVLISSIFPPNAKLISRKDGLKLIKPIFA